MPQHGRLLLDRLCGPPLSEGWAGAIHGFVSATAQAVNSPSWREAHGVRAPLQAWLVTSVRQRTDASGWAA